MIYTQLYKLYVYRIYIIRTHSLSHTRTHLHICGAVECTEMVTSVCLYAYMNSCICVYQMIDVAVPTATEATVGIICCQVETQNF